MGVGGLRVELDAELAGAAVDRTAEQMMHALALARVRRWILERPHIPLGLARRKSDALREPADLRQPRKASRILGHVRRFPAHRLARGRTPLHLTGREVETTDRRVVPLLVLALAGLLHVRVLLRRATRVAGDLVLSRLVQAGATGRLAGSGYSRGSSHRCGCRRACQSSLLRLLDATSRKRRVRRPFLW
jgi:hypothetical protein